MGMTKVDRGNTRSMMKNPPRKNPTAMTRIRLVVEEGRAMRKDLKVLGTRVMKIRPEAEAEAMKDLRWVDS